MKTPTEKSVEEIVTEIFDECTDYHETPDGDELDFDFTKATKLLTQTLQAERQRREEIVEVGRANFAEILEQLREMVDGTDRMLVEYIDDTIAGLALNQPNNPKV